MPFKDKASQGCMREPSKGEVIVEETQEATQAEPEAEPREDDDLPTQGISAEEERPPEKEEAVKDELGTEFEEEPEPPEAWPTLEQYKEKWDRLLGAHSAVNPGEFNRENLVPEPIPQLW